MREWVERAFVSRSIHLFGISRIRCWLLLTCILSSLTSSGLRCTYAGVKAISVVVWELVNDLFLVSMSGLLPASILRLQPLS